MLYKNENIVTLHGLLDFNANTFLGGEVLLRNKLSAWINRVNSVKLKTTLRQYYELIQLHIKNLEIFFGEESINYRRISSRVMQALIDEAEEKLADCADNEIADACLLASVQIINHYMISSYGTAAAFSKTLGMSKSASFFHEAEMNEKEMDSILSRLAEYELNNKATAPLILP